jgi:hypothetical protein
MCGHGCVYLLRDGLSGLWKLGHSKDVARRVASMTHSPSIELIRAVPAVGNKSGML